MENMGTDDQNTRHRFFTGIKSTDHNQVKPNARNVIYLLLAVISQIETLLHFDD